MSIEKTNAIAMTKIMCAETFKALGLRPHGWVSRLFTPVIKTPIHRFSTLAVGFDGIVAKHGFKAASRWILPHFVQSVRVVGAEAIPKEGPLLIASNHPGAYDALVIAANLPRSDIKIIVNIPLLQVLPATFQHFLYAPPDPRTRVKATRAALRHLQAGGALLLFASGGLDPDPACMPGAEGAISKWSPSLELFMRRVSQTKLTISIISGILTPTYVDHFFTRFRRARPDKQRISEFAQVIRQMLSPGKVLVNPMVSFAPPLTREALDLPGDRAAFGAQIIQRARELLSQHTAAALPKTTEGQLAGSR
jgi:hypothetical protein